MSNMNTLKERRFNDYMKKFTRGIPSGASLELLMQEAFEAGIDEVLENPSDFDLYDEDGAREYAVNHPPEK